MQVNIRGYPGYVYLIKCGSNYKIGRTANLQKRLGNYITHNPYTVKMLEHIYSKDCVSLENQLLDALKTKRVVPVSDWLKLNKDEVKLIRQLFKQINKLNEQEG